jgi:1,4-alpha-glucan branching enzyme
MLALCKQADIYAARPFAIVQNTDDQVLIFKRNRTVFAFNFNPLKSFTDYGFEADAGCYRTLLCSDDAAFGGFARVDGGVAHRTTVENKKNMVKLYLPSRTAMVIGGVG